MKPEIDLLDVVALIVDMPETRLTSGEVGTVVELLAPDVYEVEFSGNDGVGYAELAIDGRNLVVLHNQGAKPAVLSAA